MKTITRFCTALLLTLLAAACQDENTFGPGYLPDKMGHMMKLDHADLSFAAAGGTQTIQVRAMGPHWKFDGIPSWLTISSTSGQGDMAVTFTAQENASTSAREATLRFMADERDFSHSKDIKVRQDGATEYHTTATTTPLIFAATPAAPQTIAVTSNEAWTATVTPAEAVWCSVLPSTSTGSGTITVTATENTATTPRTATITIKGKTSGDETTVTVTQKGKSEDTESQAFTVTGNGKTVTFKMVRVEHGTFQMGATTEQGSDADSDEKPEHTVTLTSDYYMGETEVTQALWYAVMGQKPTASGSQWNSTYGLGDQRPAYYISWNDCQEFITKLNALTGKTFRMPTEAEWEFAARGGNKSKGYKYAGSNTIGDVAWYWDNSSSQTHDVATKQPNELGLYDMSGNVWEWCSDWYSSSYYSSSPSTDPTGPTSGSGRVFRGGSWNYNAGYCRVAYRSLWGADNRSSDLGLRLALQ